MTCRGFFCYCRSVIDYATTHNIKFYAMSPAHANSSVIEAWFSLVRSSRQDSASGYCAFVKNVQMRNATKALEGNNAYSADDVGDISIGEEADIRDLIRQQSSREKEKDRRLSQFKGSRLGASIEGSDAFSIDENGARLPKSSESEVEVLKLLTATRLPNGYIDELTKDDTFHQWLRLSIGNETDAWFQELLRSTQNAAGSASFDLACQRVMDKLLRITAELMTKRQSLTLSFEAQVHNFFKSSDYDDICTEYLPASLSESHPGCMLLGLMLSKLYKDWLTSALEEARRSRNPELFATKQASDLSVAEENNEVNTFVGWSIFSALKKYAEVSGEDNESKRLLLSMIMLEEDADEEYISKYYDKNMSMMNCGGLTLVSKYFFEWGKAAMKNIRNSFTHDQLTKNLRTSFRDGKRRVLENKYIHHKFVTLCQSSPMLFQQGAIDEVYRIILQKMVHSRFAVVFRRWKEKHCQKHDVSLRSKLKASVDTNSSRKQQKRPAPVSPEQPPECDAADIKKLKTRQVNN